MSLENDATQLGKKAKEAANRLAENSTEEKNQALLFMAERLGEQEEYLLRENKKDLEFARKKGLSKALLDRIALSPNRIEAMANGLREVARLPDPVREIVKTWHRPNGLQVERMQIPLGVIGIIYEARPNVTADAMF